MSNDISAIESALILGDLSRLKPEERLSYYKRVCESVGLNPLTKPFEYITLNGKLTLYAKRDATDQLRKIHKVSISITGREKIDDVYVVTAQAKDSTGRVDESTGAVTVTGLKGDNLANAFLKCETKAKRRVTLSICGLGLLDETELDSIAPEHKAPAEPAEVAPSKTLGAPINNHAIFETPEPGNYEVTFGKYKGQRLKQIDTFELANYVEYIKKSAADQGKTLQNGVLAFVEAAEAHIEPLRFERG